MGDCGAQYDLSVITPRRAVAACLAGGLLLLAACSDDPAQPSTLPSGSPSWTSSPTPSAAATGEISAAQAESAVRGYYAEAIKAAATGETAALEAMSATSCTCRRLVTYIEEKWKAGSIRGAEFRVSDVMFIGSDAATADVVATLSVPAYEVLDKAGRVIERPAALPPFKENFKLGRAAAVALIVIEITKVES